MLIRITFIILLLMFYSPHGSARRIWGEENFYSYLRKVYKYNVIFDEGKGDFSYYTKEINRKHPHIVLNNNQCKFSHRLRGPIIALRFVVDVINTLGIKGASDYFGEDVEELLKKAVTLKDEYIRPILLDITDRAKKGDAIARQFIEKIGLEIGRALSVFIYKYRKEDFVKNIILVGSVGENFGRGMKGEEGEDLFISSIKIGIKKTLMTKYGLKENEAAELASGITRSQFQDPLYRELYAFIPSRKDEMAVALSVGGTKVSAGLLNFEGQIMYRRGFIWRQKSSNLSKEMVLRAIYEIVKEIIEQSGQLDSITQIGISWPGSGDYQKGIVSAPNILGRENLPVKQYLQSKLREDYGKEIEIIIKNDGLAAVEVETGPLGTLPDKSDAMVVIIGTGIGGGILKQGRDFNEWTSYFVNEIGRYVIYTSE